MKKILFALLTLLWIPLTSAGGGGVTGQLWLEPIGGTYIGNHSNDWLEESWIISLGNFELNVTNHHQHKTIYYLYIITAVNADPGAHTVSVEINGTQITEWAEATTGVKIEVPTNPPYEYPPHGIYQTGTWYNITKLHIPGGLKPNENTIVSINTSGNPPNVKIHFDGVGADNDNSPVVFVPPSHDATSQIPEFPVIALPVTILLGIVYYFSSKRANK